MFYNKNRLNNVVFPLWFMLLLIPPFLFLFIFGNFIIDSLVVIISLKLLKHEFKIKNIILTILVIWIIGYIYDFVGSLIIFYLKKIGIINLYNAFENILILLIYILIILFVGLLIGIIDYFILYRKIKDKNKARTVSIALGIITAPWFFCFQLIGF